MTYKLPKIEKKRTLIPQIRVWNATWTKHIKAMAIGESFVTNRKADIQGAYHGALRLNAKVVTRKLEKGGWRVWRVK